MRSENDQPDFENGKRQGRRAANSDASPLKLVSGAMLKESIMKLSHALLGFATLAVPAVTTAAPVPQSIAVEAGDLDFGSDKGQRILALRIQRAARAMCKSQALESLPRNIRSERRCIREAQASAEAAVRNLTAASDPTPGRGG